MNNNSFTIVYKTYKNDLLWLEFSLKSLQKYVLPFNQISKILIYTHDVCFSEVEKLSHYVSGIFIEIKPVHYDYHGYIKQMIVKAMAFLDVQTDYIIYVDSDCIFTDKYDMSILINNIKKPYWYITDDVNNEGITVWHDVVKDMTGSKMKNYYMYNSFPFIIKTSTLKLAYDKFIEIHKKTYDEFCKEKLDHFGINVGDSIVNNFSKLSKVFTEFEFIGYVAFNFTDDYEFIINQQNKKNLKQYWSHGGISEEIRNEISKST